MLGDMIYLMRPAAEAVGIWTKEISYVKRVNSLYSMVSGKLDYKENKRFDSLSWSLVFRYLYTSRVYIIIELDEEQYQYWKAQNNKR